MLHFLKELLFGSYRLPTTARGDKRNGRKAFLPVYLFAPKSIFSTEIPKLWHFSSRLQREGKVLLSSAHICFPGGSGCSPGPLHNHRNTKTDLRCLLLGLAAKFHPLRRLYSRNTTFPDPEGTGRGVTGVFPTCFLLQHSVLLPIASCCLPAPMHGKWGDLVTGAPPGGPEGSKG